LPTLKSSLMSDYQISCNSSKLCSETCHMLGVNKLVAHLHYIRYQAVTKWMTSYAYKVLRDVILLMNSSEELPFTMSPMRLHHRNRQFIISFCNLDTELLYSSPITYKSVSWARLERVAGSGPWKELPWKRLQKYNVCHHFKAFTYYLVNKERMQQ
jgi:hypothetical protein